jgi:hypothetical protein
MSGTLLCAPLSFEIIDTSLDGEMKGTTSKPALQACAGASR